MMYPAIIARYIVEGNMSMGEPIDSELADAFADFLPRFKRWVEHLLPPGGPTAVRVRLLGMVHCEGPQKMSGLATAQDTPTSASTTSAPSSPGSDHPPTRGSSPLPLHLGSRGQKLYGRTFRRDRRVTPRHRGRSHPWSR